MRGYGVGLRVVGICLLLLGARGVARAQNEAFSEAEKRAFSEFEVEEELTSAAKFTTQFGARLTQAQVRYEEHFSIFNTDSTWEAWLTRGDLMLTSYYEMDDGNDMGLEIDFGIFRTTTEEEDWDRNDYYDVDGQTLRITDQKNDTDFNGWELKLALGWVHDFEGPWKLKNLVSYGRRIIEFDRRNFTLTGTLDEVDYESKDSSIASEEYVIDYLGYSPHLMAKLKEGWCLSLKPGVAYVVRSEAYNDYYDVSIDGEGGGIASVEAKLGYQFTEGLAGYIGGIWEWQYLEGDAVEEDIGGVETIIEWPDNDLYTYGLIVELIFDL